MASRPQQAMPQQPANPAGGGQGKGAKGTHIGPKVRVPPPTEAGAAAASRPETARAMIID
eukprot:6522211-Pyramimonas_sp.AAC.1